MDRLTNKKVNYNIVRLCDDVCFSDYDVTSKFLQTESDWVELFDYLNERKEVENIPDLVFQMIIQFSVSGHEIEQYISCVKNFDV